MASVKKQGLTSAPAACSASPLGCFGREAVLYLLGSGVLWVTIALLLSLAGLVQAFSPGFMAGCSWMHFGHIRPAADAAFIYGFASSAGLGLALWIFAKAGQTAIKMPGSILIGTAVWNLGVTYGVTKILCCGGTGFRWLEFPEGANGLLLLGFVLIAIPALVTFRSRQTGIGPAQAFGLAALFFFPWLFATASALLGSDAVRGVVQLSIAGWFTAGLVNLWLSFLALSALFHFIPAALGKPVADRGLAAFALWSLAFIGSWTGIQLGTPVPAWVSSLSNGFAFALILPVVAIAAVLFQTARNDFLRSHPPQVLFFAYAVKAFVLGNLLLALGAIPAINRIVRFTPFGEGANAFLFYGFIAMAMFGALYVVLPELLDTPWPKPAWVKLHFYAASAGIAAWAVALVVAGLGQGKALTDPTVPFLQAVGSAKPLLTLAAIGCVLFSLGFALLGFNFTLQLWSLCRRCCNCADWFAADKAVTKGARA